MLRRIGALALLLVGAIHLEQYFAANLSAVPIVGPLFLLNFVGSTLTGLLLLAPLHALLGRNARSGVIVLALAGVTIPVVALLMLFVAETGSLFGFEERAYRPEVIVAIGAEVATAGLLGAALVRHLR